MTAQTQHPREAEWREPLTDEQLVEVLTALTGIVDEGSNCDFVTTISMYQARESHEGRPGLSAAEAEHLAWAVRASIPEASRGSGLWRENALFIDDYLTRSRAEGPDTEEAARRILSDLLRAALRFVESGRQHAVALSADAAPSPNAAAPERPTPIDTCGCPRRAATGEDREL